MNTLATVDEVKSAVAEILTQLKDGDNKWVKYSVDVYMTGEAGNLSHPIKPVDTNFFKIAKIVAAEKTATDIYQRFCEERVAWKGLYPTFTIFSLEDLAWKPEKVFELPFPYREKSAVVGSSIETIEEASGRAVQLFKAYAPPMKVYQKIKFSCEIHDDGAVFEVEFTARRTS